MSKYVVISLYCTGRGKKVFKSGDKVTESDVVNATELVSKGFLKPLVEEEYSSDNSKDDPLFVIIRDNEEIKVFEEKDIHKKEIMKLLDAIEGLEFDPADNKATLWDLLISNKAK